MAHIMDEPFPDGVYDDAEAAIVRYARMSTQMQPIDAVTYQALARHFNPAQLVDICYTVGLSNMVNRFHATFLTDLGLVPEPHPSGMGDHIPADPVGRTSVPGVWIAGNATDPSAQVGAAAAAGAMAGAQINAELVMAETAAAVAERRARAGQVESVPV